MANNYRQKFIKANPGVSLQSYPGYWYRCANCGNWCGRPGMSGVFIPDYMKMEVDHILPWSHGGTDTLDNLQPMCKPCNRAKGNQVNPIDMQRAYMAAAAKGKQLRFKKRRKSRTKSKSGNYY